MLIMIWDEVFCKIRLSSDGLVTRKEFFSGSNYRIKTHLDVVVEVLEIQSSLSLELFIDEYLIEF